jgi:hypothetical protein
VLKNKVQRISKPEVKAGNLHKEESDNLYSPSDIIIDEIKKKDGT